MDDDVEPRDLVAGKRFGQLGEGEAIGNVDQRILAFEIEVRVQSGVGVEERFEAVGRDPAGLRRSTYLTVFLDRDADRARQAAGTRLESDAPPFAGDPAGMVDHLGALQGLGIDAFQLVFAGFPATDDIELFVDRVVPVFR